jgi:hypothetical protein
MAVAGFAERTASRQQPFRPVVRAVALSLGASGCPANRVGAWVRSHADGHHRGNARVERSIRMVVQKDDGTTETLTPSDFDHKYGFNNELDKVRLIEE